MISVCFQGGLANRMFEYAFYRNLAKKGHDVYVDNHNFKPRARMTYEAVDMKDAFPDIEMRITPEGMFRYSCAHGYKGKLLRFFNSLITKEKYIFQPKFGYCPEIYDMIEDNSNIIGLFQSEKFFAEISEDIRYQFTFLTFTEERNIEMSRLMSSDNSVAIHIRKGSDYTNDKFWSGTCPASYYCDAINYIKKNVKNPHFYLFTDNIKWVHNNIKDIDYTLIDWNPIKGKYNFRDMQLMSCAKHNIISNSSYSWWGAWLNPNPNKIVVAPKVWFNPDIISYRKNDIVCESWVAI